MQRNTDILNLIHQVGKRLIRIPEVKSVGIAGKVRGGNRPVSRRSSYMWLPGSPRALDLRWDRLTRSPGPTGTPSQPSESLIGRSLAHCSFSVGRGTASAVN
jgi:hypothetical protein